MEEINGKRKQHVSVFQALILMLTFGTFVIALVEYLDHRNK
ncbi:putative holin-like toxin [Lactobacillus sp. ESL0791]